MNIEHLVDMANRIGTFFASMTDQDEAQKEVASHIQKYWPPLMRQAILDLVAAPDHAGLHPLLLNAVRRYGGELAPRARS